MTRWRGCSASEGGDEVQKSLELLDSVLSEFDDPEGADGGVGRVGGGAPAPNGARVGGAGGAGAPALGLPPQSGRSLRSLAGGGGEVHGGGTGGCSSSTSSGFGSGSGSGSGSGEGDLLVAGTPEDDSATMVPGTASGGSPIASEDDGYMSMNGRRARASMGAKSTILQAPDKPLPPPPPSPPPPDYEADPEVDFPPPPEEAQRVLATLLPSSVQRSTSSGGLMRSCTEGVFVVGARAEAWRQRRAFSGPDGHYRRNSAATQTTLPKARHPRPFGWQSSLPTGLLPPPHRFRSLPPGVTLSDDELQERPLPASPSPSPPPPPPPPQPKAQATPQSASPQTSQAPVAGPASWASIRPGMTGPIHPRGGADRRERRNRLPANAAPSESSRNSAGLGKDRQRFEVDSEDHFSEDSLEDLPPPPPPPPPPPQQGAVPPLPIPQRGSIAWEVPLNEDAPKSGSLASLLTPGSTKVVGRRRRRSSAEHSSSSSIHRLRDQDDWPEPPSWDTSTAPTSPSSANDLDIDYDDDYYDRMGLLPAELSASDLSSSGTYVIRKGRKRERQQVPRRSASSAPQASNTFDNLKSLAQDGLIEDLADPPPEFCPPAPNLVRVVSLPSLVQTVPEPPVKPRAPAPNPIHIRMQELAVTPEEDTPSSSQTTDLPQAGAMDSLEPVSAIETDHSSSSSEPEIVPVLNGDAPRRRLPSPTLNGERSRPRKSASSSDVFGEIRRDPLPGGGVGGANRRSVEGHPPQKSASAVWRPQQDTNHVQVIPVKSASPGAKADEPAHEFGPLPPSPVEEDEEDEYSEIVEPGRRGKADTLPEPIYRVRDTPDHQSRYHNRQHDGLILPLSPHSQAPQPPPHRDPMHSLKSRSVDAGFTRGYRSTSHQPVGSHRRENQVPSERRTLPPELAGPTSSRCRRTLQRRGAHSPLQHGHGYGPGDTGSPSMASKGMVGTMQSSCSLPETPIFARGCDIPRTPHRRAPEVPSRTSNRPGGLQNSYRKVSPVGEGTLHSVGGPGGGLGVTTNGDSAADVSAAAASIGGLGPALGPALVGAELLRMAGGPGRGWYPRHRHPRPASIEHLDRVLAPPHHSPSGQHSPWDARDSRKPMTLPPNMTPKFFHRSPREALRRVTSLLIRGKGSSSGSGASSSKSGKKDTVSPSGGATATSAFCLDADPRDTRQRRRDGRFADDVCGLRGSVLLSEGAADSPRQKRGFFKGFWKRSRHYTLDHQ